MIMYKQNDLHLNFFIIFFSTNFTYMVKYTFNLYFIEIFSSTKTNVNKSKSSLFFQVINKKNIIFIATSMLYL